MRKAPGWTAGLLIILVAGCNSARPASPGTGADAVVRDYYEAIVRKDWNEAYAALHAESRAKVSAAAFAQQAASYRRRLGFEPQQVVVRSCEEHGTEALAHIVLKGGARSFKDAVVLRQQGSQWRVVLPPRFGEGQ
jgi:putative alpha-1,2-mannosidase